MGRLARFPSQISPRKAQLAVLDGIMCELRTIGTLIGKVAQTRTAAGNFFQKGVRVILRERLVHE